MKVIKAIGGAAKGVALAGLESILKNKERVVTILTPLVFAPLAASAAVLAGKYFPGVDLPTDKLVGLAVTGFLGGVGLAITWLRGAQKEADNKSAERVAAMSAGSGSRKVDDAAAAAATKVVADTPVAPTT